MGVCGNHWKWLQLRSCKICCKSIRKTIISGFCFCFGGKGCFGVLGVESPHGGAINIERFFIPQTMGEINETHLRVIENNIEPFDYFTTFYVKRRLEVSFSSCRERVRRHCWIYSFWIPTENCCFVWIMDPPLVNYQLPPRWFLPYKDIFIYIYIYIPVYSKRTTNFKTRLANHTAITLVRKTTLRTLSKPPSHYTRTQNTSNNDQQLTRPLHSRVRNNMLVMYYWCFSDVLVMF